LLGLERIPKEDNINYRRRLFDVYKHRGGTNYLPLLNSVIRELDITFDDAALTLIPHADFAKDYPNSTANIAIVSDKVQIFCDLFYVKHERHKIDPFDWTIELKKMPTSTAIKIESPVGNEIPNKSNWYSKKDKIHFKNNLLLESPIFISYSYAESLSKKGKTFKDAADFITNMAIDSTPLFSVITGSTVDTGSPVDYLQKIGRAAVLDRLSVNNGGDDSTGLSIKWANCNIEALQDEGFYGQYVNQHNNYFGTKINTYADNLSAKFKIQWGLAVADRSVWQTDKNEAIGRTSLPTNYDFTYGYWAQQNSGFITPLSSNEAYAYNYSNIIDGSELNYIGVDPDQLKSGIGANTDLLVTVREKSTRVIPVTAPLQTTRIISQTASSAPPSSAGGNTAGIVTD